MWDMREKNQTFKKRFILWATVGSKIVNQSVIVEIIFREVDLFGLGYLISSNLRQKTCDKFNYILVLPL